MTTAQFIAKTFNTRNDKWGRYGYERRCSSVFTDRDGNVYSYGYHYPLLFTIEGLTFINTTGYSSTTIRHIAWAKRAVGYSYIGVELNGARLPITLDDIEAKLGAKVVELHSEMQAKKRKDTQVYKYLEQEYEQTLADYNRVKERNS